ncbi:unnamed protein product [Merluccius merluccius]
MDDVVQEELGGVRGRGYAGGGAPQRAQDTRGSKGLINQPGQNNCFLNSALQVLWHLDIFRRSFRQISSHKCSEESCVFCALKSIFSELQYSSRSVLPSDSLRSALANTFSTQQRFQLGRMDDAAECFENILMRIHFHISEESSQDLSSSSHCTSSLCIPHQKFSMMLYEQCVCRSCGASSDPLPFIQMIHYISTTSLCNQAVEMLKRRSDASPAMFGELLRNASSVGDLRNCPANCGAQQRIFRVLLNSPEVVTIGLVWDSPTSDLAGDLIHALGTRLRLGDLFGGVEQAKARRAELYLVGVVCYYGRHYSSFFYHTPTRTWQYCDDEKVTEIGPWWRDVVWRCIKGRYQPLLLLYADPRGTPVVLHQAPPPHPNSTLQHLNTSYDSEDSGREPSISSDTRTDSSESCSLPPETTAQHTPPCSQRYTDIWPHPPVLCRVTDSNHRHSQRKVGRAGHRGRSSSCPRRSKLDNQASSAGYHSDGEVLKECQAASPPPRSSSSRRLRDLKDTMSSIIHSCPLSSSSSSSSSLPSSSLTGLAPKVRDWETDSSSSESQAGGSVGRIRPAWRPRREGLNIDSIFSRERRRQAGYSPLGGVLLEDQNPNPAHLYHAHLELDELQDEVWRQAREEQQQREREREREAAMGFNPTPSKILDLDQLQIQGTGGSAERCVSEVELHLDQSVRLEKAGEVAAALSVVNEAVSKLTSTLAGNRPSNQCRRTGSQARLQGCLRRARNLQQRMLLQQDQELQQEVQQQKLQQEYHHGYSQQQPSHQLVSAGFLEEVESQLPQSTSTKPVSLQVLLTDRQEHQAPPSADSAPISLDPTGSPREDSSGAAGSFPPPPSGHAPCTGHTHYITDRNRPTQAPAPCSSVPPPAAMATMSVDHWAHNVNRYYDSQDALHGSLNQELSELDALYQASLRAPSMHRGSSTTGDHTLQERFHDDENYSAENLRRITRSLSARGTGSRPQNYSQDSSRRYPDCYSPPPPERLLSRECSDQTDRSSLEQRYRNVAVSYGTLPRAPPTSSTTSSLRRPWAPPTASTYSSLRRPRAPPTSSSTTTSTSLRLPQAPPTSSTTSTYSSLRLPRAPPTSSTTITTSSSLLRPRAPPTSFSTTSTYSSLRLPRAPPTSSTTTTTSSLLRPRAPPTSSSSSSSSSLRRQGPPGPPSQAPSSALGGWRYATLQPHHRPHPTYPHRSIPSSPAHHTSPAPRQPQRVDVPPLTSRDPQGPPALPRLL